MDIRPICPKCNSNMVVYNTKNIVCIECHAEDKIENAKKKGWFVKKDKSGEQDRCTNK